jgi:hypothetical protein
MSLYETVMGTIRKNRESLQGEDLNCIVFPYKRFRGCFPGQEKGKYYGITGNQKSAKSKWTDYTFLYEPFFDMIENNGPEIHCMYFTLEMSPSYKMLEFMCHALYRISGGSMRYSPRQAKSVGKGVRFPDEAMKVMESDEFRNICEKWEETVEYITDQRNPTGINKAIKERALAHGHYIFRDPEKQEGVIGYKPDNEDIYEIIIIDNLANLSIEREFTERQNINKLSKYIVAARDLLNYTFIVIQHQAQSVEDKDSFKFNKGEPTSAGLGNSKEICRDLNMLFGIYSPFKMGLSGYKGYDISRLRNYARFVKVLEDRDGDATGEILPLLFDGAVSIFDEMPKSFQEKEMEDFYRYAEAHDSMPGMLSFMRKSTPVGIWYKIRRMSFLISEKVKQLWEK